MGEGVIHMAEIGVSSYRRFLQGDQTALEELIREYSDSLVRYAYCYVKDTARAEEMMEDAFVQVLLQRKSIYDEQRLKAYLYKATRNRCIDYLRRHRREVPLEDVENILFSPGADVSVYYAQRNQTIYKCMQVLPRQYREVLELAYFEDFSVECICLVTGKRPKQVYNLLARAKTALRTLLEKEGITHEDI